MKKLTIWIIAVLLAVGGIVYFATRGSQGSQLKVGVLTTLTGESAKYGRSALNGIRMAADNINANGGIDGKQVRLVVEDDGSDPGIAVTAFTKLATIDKVPVIIGPISSSAAMACSPVANHLKVVLFSPSAATPEFSSFNDFTFRNRVSSEFEIVKLAEYAYHTLALRSVAILYVNNDYGLGNMHTFETEFERLGGIVPKIQTFQEGSVDLRAQLTQIKSSHPDGIFLVGQGTEGGYALRQARELGIGCRFLSTITIERADVLRIAGNAANGVVFTAPYYAPDSSTKGAKFENEYKKLYGYGSDMFAGNGYDAMYIVAKAIENGGYSSVGIKRALFEIKDFTGVTGKTSFDSSGDVEKPESLMEIEHGRFLNIGR